MSKRSAGDNHHHSKTAAVAYEEGEEEEDFHPIYVNDEIINKPRTYHITSFLSIDAQYSMIKVYEDMMRRRLAILYPHRLNSAPIISAEAFYALCKDESAELNEKSLNDRNELIERKIKKMSKYVEEGIKLLDVIDTYVTDAEKLDAWQKSNEAAAKAAMLRRESIVSRRSSVAASVSSSKYNVSRASDPLVMYTKWVNAWNKEYNNRQQF
jgi:hypothetical protein